MRQARVSKRLCTQNLSQSHSDGVMLGYIFFNGSKVMTIAHHLRKQIVTTTPRHFHHRGNKQPI